jgi:hypothetical protein
LLSRAINISSLRDFNGASSFNPDEQLGWNFPLNKAVAVFFGVMETCAMRSWRLKASAGFVSTTCDSGWVMVGPNDLEL